MALISFEDSGLPNDLALKNIFNALCEYSFKNSNLKPSGITTAEGQVTEETLAAQQRLRDYIEKSLNSYVESFRILTAPDIDQNVSARAIGTMMIEETMQTAEAYSGRSSAEYRPILAAEFKARVAGSPNTAYFEQQIEDYANAGMTTPELQAEIDARLGADTPENALMGAMITLYLSR